MDEKADLTITNLIAPNAATIDQEIGSLVEVGITNNGNADAAIFNVAYYLYSSMDPSGERIWLGNSLVSQVKMGETVVHKPDSLRVPSAITPGDYHLVIILNPISMVEESSYTNNTEFSSIRIESGTFLPTPPPTETIDPTPTPTPPTTSGTIDDLTLSGDLLEIIPSGFTQTVTVMKQMSVLRNLQDMKQPVYRLNAYASPGMDSSSMIEMQEGVFLVAAQETSQYKPVLVTVDKSGGVELVAKVLSPTMEAGETTFTGGMFSLINCSYDKNNTLTLLFSVNASSQDGNTYLEAVLMVTVKGPFQATPVKQFQQY